MVGKDWLGEIPVLLVEFDPRNSFIKVGSGERSTMLGRESVALPEMQQKQTARLWL